MITNLKRYLKKKKSEFVTMIHFSFCCIFVNALIWIQTKWVSCPSSCTNITLHWLHLCCSSPVNIQPHLANLVIVYLESVSEQLSKSNTCKNVLSMLF